MSESNICVPCELKRKKQSRLLAAALREELIQAILKISQNDLVVLFDELRELSIEELTSIRENNEEILKELHETAPQEN